jgi:hypothetical protein
VEVLAVQLRSTLCAIPTTPVPVKDVVPGELLALLTNEAVPFAGPLVWGENTRLTVLLAPAATVNGVVAPMLNPEPDTFTAETTMLAVPLLDNVRFLELDAPTVTFPNTTDVGETLRVLVGAATPVPVKETTVGEPLKLLAIDAEPFTALAACGWNTTFAV